MGNTVSIDYGSLFTPAANGIENAISAILPVAVPVLGVLLAIGVGIKVFRKVTGR